jgi:hypothetical protein
MNAGSWIALAVAIGVPLFLYPIILRARQRDDDR